MNNIIGLPRKLHQFKIEYEFEGREEFVYIIAETHTQAERKLMALKDNGNVLIPRRLLDE